MPRKRPLPVVPVGACSFCFRDSELPLLGPLMEKDGTKFHTNCIFSASGISQEKDDGKSSDIYVLGFHISTIQLEIKRGRNLVCTHCRRQGACVGCVIPSCQAKFHLPCIIPSRGLTIFEDTFPSYCKRHAPRQNLDKWLHKTDEFPSCCVCLFSLSPEENNSPVSLSKTIVRRHTVACSLLPSCTPIKRKRPLRSSGLTASTPKRILVSDGMSSVKRKLSLSSTSTWELPDSSPEPEPRNPSPIKMEPIQPLSEALRDVPIWMASYLLKLRDDARMDAYKSWLHNTVHGFCCPKAWMHRSCIAGFAASAALHYLKCPYCADKQVFIRSIIDAGIWVPDRDAAWELEPGAYADLAPAGGSSEALNSHDRTGEPSPSTSIPSDEHLRNSSTRSRGKPTRGATVAHRQIRRSRRRTRSEFSQLRNVQVPEVDQKPTFALFWDSRRFTNRGRGAHNSSSASVRHKSRRYTQHTTFDQRSPSKQTILRRHSLRQSNIRSQPPEPRLRQSTLNHFLSPIRLSSGSSGASTNSNPMTMSVL